MAISATDSLQPVLWDVSKARGLPNEHYISGDTFLEERDAVLFNQWSGVGFVSDVPNPGDVKPLDFLGMPLLLVHDQDGGIQVFQNTCRHRGMILVDEPTNVRRVLRCPYHSWCYGLDGSLQATPHVGGSGCDTHESIEPENLSLFSIPTAVWLGVVFVNVSGTAPAFEDYTAALRNRWQDFDGLPIAGDAVSAFTLDVQTNWKLAVENFCESYHLPWIHPDLNTYSRLEDHYDIIDCDGFSGQGSHVYRQLVGDNNETFDDLGSLSEQWNTGAEYVSLFPNVLLGVHRDHTYGIVLQPMAIDRTIERVVLFYNEATADAPELNALRSRNSALWKQIFEEDVQVVEGMQRGRHGVKFDGGKFSPAMDQATHAFHQWVARCLQQHRAALA